MGCRRSVIMLDLINTIPDESITEEQAKELIAEMSVQKERQKFYAYQELSIIMLEK